MKKVLDCLVLILFFSLYSIQAQNTISNTRIAYSRPIDNITIDGKINDWPIDTDRYKINQTIWSNVKNNKSGFPAYFMSGYQVDDNTIYIAIVVEDTFFETDKDQWQDKDLYSLFIDEKHHSKGSGIARFTIAKNGKSLTSLDKLWDSELEKQLHWDTIQYAIGRDSNKTVYELRIKLQDPIYTNRIIGVGNVVQNSDLETLEVQAWIKSGDKDSSSRPGSIGMLMFIEDDTKITTVKGKVQWQDSTNRMLPEGVKFVSAMNEKDWLYLPVNKTGVFSLKLPEGDYYLKPGKTAFFYDFDYAKADTSIDKKIKVSNLKENNIGVYNLKPEKKPDFGTTKDLLSQLTIKDTKEIDRTIKMYMDYYEIEGVAIAAIKNDSVAYHQTYGVKNRYTGEKLTKDHLFEVASITKPVFAYAILRLYDKGLIDLDAKMYKILPFKKIAHSEYAKELTPRIVLSHQTGLPNWGRGKKIDFMFQPGTDFGYSGEGFEYLKRYIEKLTNKSINQILKEEVSDPLELEHMYFQYNDYAFKYKTHGHYNGYPGAIDLPQKPWVAGCLVTNTNSLTQFLIQLKNGVGLKPETFKMMLTPHSEIPDNFKENNWGYDEYMGLGIFVEKAPKGLVLRHSGNNGDFKATFRLYTHSDAGYIVMTNGNTGHFILDAIEKHLIDPTN